jgi:hypothetical protein
VNVLRRMISAIAGNPSAPVTKATFAVEVRPAASSGASYPDDARFDLLVDGERAGYALMPDEVKRQIVERLDIEMRRVGGHGPERRRSLAETAIDIERLHGRSPTDHDRANTLQDPTSGRTEDDATC